MSQKDFDYYKNLKGKLSDEKRPDILKLGYNMACGIGLLEKKLCLAVRLQPLPGSPDPIEEDLFEKIKTNLEDYLRDNNEDAVIDIRYIGIITAK